MPVDFKLPALGEGIESADVLNVLVKVGDTIAVDQAVFEAETDKAVVEIPSSVAGKVLEVNIKKGDTVKVGQVVLSVEGSSTEATPTKEAPKAQAAPEKKPEAKQQAPVPSEKKTETKAEALKPDAKPSESSRIDSPPDAPKTDAVGVPPSPSTDRESRLPIAAAPSVRQFAREIGVDIHLVQGSGEGGRITTDDVKAFSRGNAQGRPSPGVGGAPSGPRSTVEPMSKLRKTAAAHLTKAWQAPHVTLHDKADVTELEAFRNRFKDRAEKAGGKLTITPIFVKLAVAALKAHRVVNASLNMDKQEVEYKNYYNIGVAVDTPRGLVVPVIKDADRKSIVQLAVELNQLGVKAREGKLTFEEMSGGTFTITNLGSIGVGFFTPILNTPEVAILGMGRAVMEPVWNGKAFNPRLMAPLSLSFDHRLVDGADAARFLRYIVDAVTNPLVLALD